MITSEPINDATGAQKDVVAITANSDNPILNAVLDLEAIGFVMTPLHGKEPFRTGWNSETIDPSLYPSVYHPGANIGLRTGVTSKSVDIDADCDEVVPFLKEFLPWTNASYGRNSRPESHFLFSVKNPGKRATFPDAIKAEMEGTDEEKAMIVEYRGNKVQSMCPPSLHPTEGEGRLKWKDASFIRNRQRPTEATHEALMAACAKSAMAVMRLRYSEEQIAAHPKAAANMQKWQAIAEGSVDDNGAPLLAANRQPSLSERAASLVRKPDNAPTPTFTNASSATGIGAWIEQSKREEDFALISKAILYLDAGPRENWLGYGAALHDRFGDAGRALWDKLSATCPAKFDPIEQDKAWRSFSRGYPDKRITIASILRDARLAGFVHPSAAHTSPQSAFCSGGHGEARKEEQTHAGASEGDAESDDDWDDAQPKAPPLFEARLFVYDDALHIPRRQPIYAGHYVRKYTSLDIAPGGVGKSSLVSVEALAIASGKPLLGVTPDERTNVCYLNLEDPFEELQRRFLAAIQHYNLDPALLKGRLFINSGRDSEFIVAQQTREGVVIHTPLVEQVVAEIKRNNIGVLIVDPFVSSHLVSENDNGAVDAVLKLYARIADQTGCSISLIHHSRKLNGQSATVEDGRGASALLAAVRSARALNPMTENEAQSAGIENRRSYFRLESGKSNLSPPPDKAQWFKLEDVALPNGPFGSDGDHVAVVTEWHWPNPFDDVTVHDLRAVQKAIAAKGPYKYDVRSTDWVGNAIAEVLGLDVSEKSVRANIKTILDRWIHEKVLRKELRHCPKRREKRDFVLVGELA